MMPGEPNPTLFRVLDANHNRCLEGLRVLEDQVRFEREDRRLASRLKELRHAVAVALPQAIVARMHAMRDAGGDVGRTIEAADEYVRPDTTSLVRANASRVKQALRVLEEYGKALSSELGHRFEQARYEFYAIEMLLDRDSFRRGRIAAARLYVLIDGDASADDFETRLDRILAGRPDVLQLRDKSLDDRTLVTRARRLVERCRETEVLAIVNDRPDLALLSDADGVHVGQEELTAADVRRIVGPERLVGVSTHAIDQARRAVDDGADYLGAGPTFPSGTKRFEHFPGLDYLRQVAAEIGLPAFAIGGIGPELVDQVLATGMTRIAVSGSVLRSADPIATLERLRQALDRRTCGDRTPRSAD